MTDRHEEIGDRPVRFALLGCGSVASKHAVGLGRLDGAEVVGACDLDEGVATAFGVEHDVPSFRDARQMVDATDPDVINVLTPSGSHTECVLDLVSLGRHFVVEKPLGLRLESVDEVMEAVGEAGTRLFVVRQNRFNPPLWRLKEAIDEGRFGRLVLGAVRVRWTRDQAYYDAKAWRGTWAEDGGVLTNQASHHLDALLWLMGDVDSVVAKIDTKLVDIEAEDTAVALLEFSNGAHGVVEATTATRPDDLEGSISVLGQRGAVEVGGFYMNELETWQFDERTAMDETVWAEDRSVPDQFAWNHTRFFEDVVQSLREGTPSVVEGSDGRRCVQVLHAIYRSAETGEEVALADNPRSDHLGAR